MSEWTVARVEEQDVEFDNKHYTAYGIRVDTYSDFTWSVEEIQRLYWLMERCGIHPPNPYK